MKLHFYPEVDCLYVAFGARPGVDTIEVIEGLNVDVDANGEVVGFDIDHASQRLNLHIIETEALLIHHVKAS